LRRDGDELSLTVEHRAAPSIPGMALALAERGDALALEIVDRSAPVTPTPTSLDERIITALGQADRVLPFTQLRALCRVRTATLYERLAVLTTNGRVIKIDDGYRRAER
jgi:hypothetical protein